jgi:integrase
MPRTKSDIPSYRRHRASGHAVVTLNGRDIYLGRHGSPQSRAEYDRVVNEWLALGRHLPDRCDGESGEWLVKELIHGYRAYVIANSSDYEVEKLAYALKPVRKMYGDTPASKFGPVAFQAVRQSMIDAGLGASTIRQRLGIIKRMVGWGVANEKLPGDALYRLQAVPQLRSGRNGVKAPKKVKPAPEEDIRAILPHLNPVVRAMVELQDLTGARPGEIRRITTGQIDRSVDPWLLKVTAHKSERFGHDRTIPLGPRAQALLKPWLKADPDAPLFSPKDACERVREAVRRPTRTDQQRAKRRAKKPTWKASDLYSKGAYRWAIARACDKAKVPRFVPNQIRHTAATRIRRRFGLEAAQVVLGHSKANTTEIW